MKTLLILITLASLASGQDSTASRLCTQKENEFYSENLTQYKLVKLWDEYTTQNYRMDSTLSLTGVALDSLSMTTGGKKIYVGRWKNNWEVTKRQNFNSFDGFIKYLRGRK